LRLAVTRSRVRAVSANLTSRVPEGILMWLRQGYASSSRGSARAGAIGLLLEVVRHGGVPATVTQFFVGDEPRVALVAGDSVVLQRLYWFGDRGWEPDVVRWWKECLRYATVAVEVGANVGYYAVVAGCAWPELRYVAVEPHPVSASILRNNLALNGLHHVEVVEAAAVPGSSHEVELVIPREDHFQAPAGAFVVANSELSRDYSESQAVMAVNLAGLLGGVDVIKLDVEGQEFELLQSVKQVLYANNAVVLVELLDDARSLRVLIAEFCQNGYTATRPEDGALRRLSVAEVRDAKVADRGGNRDVILLPAEHPLLGVTCE